MKILDRVMQVFGYEKAAGRVFRTDVSSGIYGTMGVQKQQNYQTYLKQYADASWVYSCVYRIATQAASVPLKLFKKRKANGKVETDEITEHPLLDLLETVNPFMAGCDLVEATLTYEELTGNAYWLLDMYKGGKPTEIYPLNPHKVKIIPDKTNYIAGYKYIIGAGEEINLPKETILHFKYFNPNDEYYGLSPLSAARIAVDTQTYSDTYNRNFFINSAEPRGALSTEQSLSDAQRQRIVTAWQNMHRGVANAHKTALFEGGVQWMSTGISQKDMEFINTKKMTREDILGVFGIPPALVGVFEYASYANSKEQHKMFWQNTMFPKLRKYEAVLNSFLVLPHDPNLFCKFDYSDIDALQQEEKLRAEIDDILVRTGIMTINEARLSRKMKPVAWGNTWNAPMNLLPISSPRSEDEEDDEEDDAEEGKIVNEKTKTEEVNNRAFVTKTELTTEEKEKLRRDKIWIYFKNSTESWERKIKPVLRELFTGQEKEVIRNLRDSDWKSNPMDRVLPKFDYTGKDKVSVLLFSLKEATKLMKKKCKPVIESALKDKAQIEIARLGLGIDFDINNPRVQEMLDVNLYNRFKEVNKHTLNDLRTEMREALASGEGIKETEKRIENVFDMARGYRTERIARTEIISAYNGGGYEAYRQSEVVEKIEWIDSRDELVRDSHLLDGVERKLGDTFPNGLLYPGDPAGDPSELFNCRCTHAAVIKR